MSHQPERTEKNCLNCGTQVAGRYCQNCGQENVETRESFWSLSQHFVFDILHFDGKFFHTLKYFFTRPGFVARQYAEGKRATYLHPIRMYLFMSALFFLVFFSVNRVDALTGNSKGKPMTAKARLEAADDLRKELNGSADDSLKKIAIAKLRDTAHPMTRDSLRRYTRERGSVSVSGGRDYHTIPEYDSIQNSLPVAERDGWLTRLITRRLIVSREKYGSDELTKHLFESFVHRIPYMLFVSLPFFALILKLLYVRRKNFYYSDHAIFTLYHYVFSFLLMLIMFGISELNDWLDSPWITGLFTVVLLSWPVYLLLEMRYFYRQGWGKTFVKFLALNFLGLAVLILLFLVFFLFSMFQM